MGNSTMLGTRWAFSRRCIWFGSQEYQLWNGFSFSGHKQHNWRCINNLLMSKQLHSLPYRKKPGFYSQSVGALDSLKAESEMRLVCVCLRVSRPRESRSEEDGLSGWPLWPGPPPPHSPGPSRKCAEDLDGWDAEAFSCCFPSCPGQIFLSELICPPADSAPTGTCCFRKVKEIKQLLEKEARKGQPGPAESWQCRVKCKLKR